MSVQHPSLPPPTHSSLVDIWDFCENILKLFVVPVFVCDLRQQQRNVRVMNAKFLVVSPKCRQLGVQQPAAGSRGATATIAATESTTITRKKEQKTMQQRA